MNWKNVKLILAREVRDQLRDRRTLFMIAVLPLLLYPLLGMSFFQVAQFMREQPTRVLVVGLPQLDDLPPLVENDQFVTSLFLPEGDDKSSAKDPPAADGDDREDAARRARLLKLELRGLG